MAKQKAISTLAALDRESWAWLQDNAPDVAGALQVDIDNGVTPEQVYRDVMGEVELNRQAIALRLRQAGRYLVALKAAGGGE